MLSLGYNTTMATNKQNEMEVNGDDTPTQRIFQSDPGWGLLKLHSLISLLREIFDLSNV